MNRSVFFNEARVRFFQGTLSQPQVNGMLSILDEWLARGLLDLRWLAYMLATAYWETNRTMQPVREAYWLSEDWRRNNLRYYPWYGRGFVQLTWEKNYQTMARLLKLPAMGTLAGADMAMQLNVAVQILFEGMLNAESGVGDFTNRSLDEFFTATRTDWVGARKIINGTDHDREIADIAMGFHAILLKAS